MIAAMEANHPNLTNLKTLSVEISRARDRADLVTDDRAALREQLEAATGERIAALEAVEPDRAKGREAVLDINRSADLDGVRPCRESANGHHRRKWSRSGRSRWIANSGCSIRRQGIAHCRP